MSDDRLISLDAAIDAFKKELTVRESKGNYVTICSAVGYKGAKQILESLPSVDAVPVVRCKDCKWFNELGCAIHIVDESDKPKETDFCSFGERKDGEQHG